MWSGMQCFCIYNLLNMKFDGNDSHGSLHRDQNLYERISLVKDTVGMKCL